MKEVRFGFLSAILTVTLLLAGCSLFSQNQSSENFDDQSLSENSFLIFAQGSKNICDKALTNGDAKKKAEKALAREEIKALKDCLRAKARS